MSRGVERCLIWPLIWPDRYSSRESAPIHQFNVAIQSLRPTAKTFGIQKRGQFLETSDMWQLASYGTGFLSSTPQVRRNQDLVPAYVNLPRFLKRISVSYWLQMKFEDLDLYIFSNVY